MATEPESDESLYRRLREDGELGAFDRLYARYEVALFSFLRGYLPARADAEEVFHDAFVEVLRSRDVSFERGSFAAWLYKIARNLALNRLRSARRAMAAKERLDPTPPTPGADEQLEVVARAGALARALGELPLPLAELYRLRAAGMSYEQIAFALEVPLGTVKSRMHELVARLKTGVNRWMSCPR